MPQNNVVHRRSRIRRFEMERHRRDPGDDRRSSAHRDINVSAVLDSLCWPDSFADWLDRRNEPTSLKSIAYSAIEAYKVLAESTTTCERALDTLYLAASHPRFVVWEVGLPLLARLGETKTSVRDKIVELSHQRKAELRRRSIQYINDRYSRSFCVSMLSRLLTDRSAKVKVVVAGRISCLNLTELLPSIEQARLQETNEQVVWCYGHILSLLRDGYHYDERENDAILWLYYPNLYPASSPYVCDAQLRHENGENIHEIKIDTLRQYPGIQFCRRDWEWGDER